MPRTTADNLDLLKQARQRQGQELPQADEIIATLRQRGTELSGGKVRSSYGQPTRERDPRGQRHVRGRD
jgi:hypothetical protein